MLKSVFVRGWVNHVLVVDKSSLEMDIHSLVVDMVGDVGIRNSFPTHFVGISTKCVQELQATDLCIALIVSWNKVIRKFKKIVNI